MRTNRDHLTGGRQGPAQWADLAAFAGGSTMAAQGIACQNLTLPL